MKWHAFLLLIASMILAVSKFGPAGPESAVGSAHYADANPMKSHPVKSVERGRADDGSPRNPSPSVRASNERPSPNLVSARVPAAQPADEFHGASVPDAILVARTASEASKYLETDTTLPVSFMLPEYVDPSDQTETDLVYRAQSLFADTMNAESAASDPGTPEYARKWQLAKASHDDMLRLQLGHEGFFRLSVRAAQQAESAKAASAAGR